MSCTNAMFIYESQDASLAFPPSSRHRLVSERLGPPSSAPAPRPSASLAAGGLIGGAILVPVLGLSSAAIWYANRSSLARAVKNSVELETVVKAAIGREAEVTRAEMSTLKNAMIGLRHEVREASIKAQAHAQLQSEAGRRPRIGSTWRRERQG
jgi:hypothetical protein